MRALVAMIAGLSLAGCDRATEDARICLTPPSAVIPGDWKACVHRWAYRFAAAKESVAVVTEAVVGACDDAVSFDLDRAGKSKEEQAQLYSATLDLAEREAQWRVVQARAGNCAIP